MIGSTLAHYRILSPLGTGGMGEVFLARDTRLERDVAVKLIREEFAADGERLARFEREARAIAALNHPSIVTIYAIEEGSGRRFFTMELVEGRTLREVAPPAGLPAPELLRVGVALADALAAAHARGVVHRDLKPANVMTTHEGRVKVLDFGIAKLDVSGVRPPPPPDRGPTSLLGRKPAVLPFADLSAAQDQGYFCDGIAEELLAVLSRIEVLRVASRTSSVHLHHQRLDIRDIGRQLNVNAVLEGSVRKAGERLRITASSLTSRAATTSGRSASTARSTTSSRSRTRSRRGRRRPCAVS